MKNHKLSLIGISTFVAGVTALFMVVTTSAGNRFTNLSGQGSDYTITLNFSNKVTTSGEHEMLTDVGKYGVYFIYNNVLSSTSGHVSLGTGGYLVNKDHIRSIKSIVCTFNVAESLSFKISYDGATWNADTTMVSGYRYDIGSAPYYVQLTASKEVAISELKISYSCVENPQAHEEAEPSSGVLGVIDFWDVSNANDTQTATVVNTSYVSDHSYNNDSDSRVSANLVTSVSASNVYQDRYGGIGLSSKNNPGNLTLTLANNIAPKSITVIAGSQNATKNLSLNDINKSVTANCSGIDELSDDYTNTLTWNFEEGQTEINLDCVKSSKMAIYKIYLHGESGPTYDVPTADIIGFGAEDSEALTYTHEDVFDTANGLSVWANTLGNGTIDLAKGGENGYSYVVKNSNNETIDTSKPFGTEGSYTLIVSYKNFIPVEIPLTVGYKVNLTAIAVNSSTLLFNTAQKLSDFTSGITAGLTYNKTEYNQTVDYADFASNKVALTLLNPSGVSTPITNLFGVAGTWTIKVSSTENESVYGIVEITVNAIAVTNVSVSGSATEVEVGKQLQLNAAVTPNNATNPTVTWTSSNTSVAEVNLNGLVTGVSVGTARITATSTDGSNKAGYVDVTVVAPTVVLEPYEVVFDTASSDATQSYTASDYYNGIASGADYISSASNVSKVFKGVSGLKFGSSSVDGSITFNLTSAIADETITTIDFETVQYGSVDATLTCTVGSKSETISYNESGSLTINGKVSSISFASSKRIYLVGFTMNRANAAPSTPVYPTQITLSASKTSIAIGETSTLSYTYQPDTTNVLDITYSSNHTNIATVSTEGIVTGVAAGSAEITATAKAANNTTITSKVTITVSAVSVTSVSLNKADTSLKIGATETLTATVSPSNATNKNVTWSSSNTSIATVSNGTVTAKAVGTATITVTTVDGNKTATCTVAVTSSPEETFTISYTDLPTSYQTTSTVYTADSGIKFQAYNCANYSNKVQFKASSGYLQSTESLQLQSVTINDRESNTLTVYGSNTAGSFSTEISGTNDVYDLSGYQYFKIARTASGAAYCSSITVKTGVATPTDPTAITVSPKAAELSPNGTKTLSVSYTPSNANQNKAVTWSSSDTTVATVSSEGVVQVKSTATAGQTATITARLTNLTSIYDTCVITVVAQQNDDQTILIYLCGSDLESGGKTSSSGADANGAYATGDLQEILSVSNQPDDVNVVIETGGAKAWASKYGISKDYLTRYHVANKQLVKDEQVTKASMGETSTLQSFLTWGIQTYPADRISLILWNHGGAMRGVCYDENYNSNPLTNSEVHTAVKNTFTALGRSTSDKLEWIGYDACLMAVQDIAEFNSDYFNYMVASEESEAGAGWDYDTWIDDAYSKKSTETILTAIVDGFIADTNKQYQQNGWGTSDQTLSWCDLSYMAAYKTAWETMSSKIKSMIGSMGKSNFQTLMKTCKYYGSDDESEGYSYFGIFDAKDVLTKIKNNSNFSGASTELNNAITAFGNLVRYSKKGAGAGNSYGLCCFFPMTDGSGYTCNTSSVYTVSQTNFTNWRSIVTTYGD